MIAGPKRQLSLFDSISIMLGIIIGGGIYETAPTVAACTNNWLLLLGFWFLGGVISLAGAFCYAGLASAYPKEGGDYLYLSKAYGNWLGFLFAWGRITIVQPGSIAALAFLFGRYFATLFALDNTNTTFFASCAVIALTLLNCLGVRSGKWTQNILTIGKLLGVMLILTAAFFVPKVSLDNPLAQPWEIKDLNLGMILILFCYGGWNEIAYVAAEVKDPQRNLTRSLVLTVIIVTAIYILMNLSFVSALGYERLTRSTAVANDIMQLMLPESGDMIISLLICITTLGAANGMIFTGARISYAVGLEHSCFHKLAAWSSRLDAPCNALVLQGLISLSIIMVAGSFNHTVVYTTAVVWFFFFATSFSVFILSRKNSKAENICRVVGYPFTPIVACLASAFLTLSAFLYNMKGSAFSLVILLAGLPLYLLSRSSKRTNTN